LAPLASPAVYRINVDEYERMATAGVLDDDRIELIDGYLVRKMSKSPPHIWSTAALFKAIEAVSAGWWCRKEDPVRIPEFDEPEPDVSVVRGSLDDYRNRIPGPKEIGLVVEVSESTLDRDEGEKRAAYARGRIPVYRIINLIDRQVQVYSGPTARGYRSSRVYKAGQEIPVVLAGAEVGRIRVDDIMP
jgi:Uma2 family endonuclease